MLPPSKFASKKRPIRIKCPEIRLQKPYRRSKWVISWNWIFCEKQLTGRAISAPFGKAFSRDHLVVGDIFNDLVRLLLRNDKLIWSVRPSFNTVRTLILCYGVHATNQDTGNSDHLNRHFYLRQKLALYFQTSHKQNAHHREKMDKGTNASYSEDT